MFSTWEYCRSPQASPALPQKIKPDCPEVQMFTCVQLRTVRFHLFKGYLTQEAPSTHYSSGPQTFLVQGDTTYKYFFLYVASRSYIFNFPSPLLMTYILVTFSLFSYIPSFHNYPHVITWQHWLSAATGSWKFFVFFNSAHIVQILQFISIVVLVPALVGQRWVWLRDAATEGHSGSCAGFFFCMVCLFFVS